MSRTPPLVSVITPCWNAAAYLQQTIESVQKQSLSDWELIIADDASSDASVSIIQEFLTRDTRVRLIQSPCNRGPQEMRNLATTAARGRYIAFLDSDDWWLPHALQYRIEYMSRQGVEFVCAAYEQVDAQGQGLGEFWPRRRLRYHDLLMTNDIPCSTVIYDSWLLGKIYNFHLYGVDDYVMWLQVLKRGITVHGLQEILTAYRQHADSRSWNKWQPVRQQWQTYRRVEQLSFLFSLYCFLCYAMHGLHKYWRPALRMLWHRAS